MTRPDFGQLPQEVWQGLQQLNARRSWVCGYCGDKVGAAQGYKTMYGGNQGLASIAICETCHAPTLFVQSGEYFPKAPPGGEVAAAPVSLAALYREARISAGAGAFTAAVLVCRKILMNIAVQEGAEEGQNFAAYVSYLADQGFVPPNGRAWVDYIRKRANEANHEIELMNEQDASALVTLTEMLLRFIYEMPAMVPQITQASEGEPPQT